MRKDVCYDLYATALKCKQHKGRIEGRCKLMGCMNSKSGSKHVLQSAVSSSPVGMMFASNPKIHNNMVVWSLHRP